jgi:hypothetical protein
MKNKKIKSVVSGSLVLLSVGSVVGALTFNSHNVVADPISTSPMLSSNNDFSIYGVKGNNFLSFASGAPANTVHDEQYQYVLPSFAAVLPSDHEEYFAE